MTENPVSAAATLTTDPNPNSVAPAMVPPVPVPSPAMIRPVPVLPPGTPMTSYVPLPPQHYNHLPGQQVQMPGQQVQMPGQQVQMPGQQVQMPGQQVQMPGQQVQMPGQHFGQQVPGQQHFGQQGLGQHFGQQGLGQHFGQQMPNGYQPPPGIPHYGAPYNPMLRPGYIPRGPGLLGSLPQVMRPPMMAIRGPLPPLMRPAIVPNVATEKPQTTVYVGKIACTIEHNFILALLQLCGPIKSWKRPQDPTTGKPKGFGLCEFDSAEGVLRALRLLNKLSLDGQELMINFNQATREYLERYVQKKTEGVKKLKEDKTVSEKEDESASSAEKSELPKPSDEESKNDDNDAESEKKLDTANFGIVTDQDREADREILDKIRSMIEERLKNNPLPPPPRLPAPDGSNTPNLEKPAESKDADSNVDTISNVAGEDKRDEQMACDSKPPSVQDKLEASSPDRERRNDRRSRDSERDKREKERELERYEKEREQERSRRERERKYKSEEDDRRYKAHVKEWESREREKEYLRKQDKEEKKEREYKRKQDVLDQELEGDEGDYKKRKHKGYRSDDRKRRLREKEEDLADRLREEEEVAEAKRRAEEELRQLNERVKDELESSPVDETNESNTAVLAHSTKAEVKDEAVDMTCDSDLGNDNHIGYDILQNGNGDESAADMLQNDNNSSKKLGFGLVGSGKRTAVPSVFNQEEDEDAHKNKKMRPLVPIDYSTEELQAVQSLTPVAPTSNLAAAAEFAKQISGGASKDDKADTERSRRSHDRSSHRDRNGDESNRPRSENKRDTSERGKDREQRHDKKKTTDNQKLLDAKQLIDMIPKTKEELFSYEIDWVIYDKNGLHGRMRPWISKKVTEFLGEDEPTLVEYIVSSTQEHVKAAEMLDRLQAILDDEAEMFVLKMWRMLIFEIKKVETGLSNQAKA